VSAWTYDAAGNLVDDGTNTYTYNARNQMTSFSDGVNLTTYGYDASGYRVTKTGSGGTVYFVMGAGEYYNGTWVRLFVTIGGKKLAEYSDNTTYFYAHDHLGGPAVITDHTGAVAARYRCYPFGEEWITEGTKSDRHRFTEAEWEKNALSLSEFPFRVVSLCVLPPRASRSDWCVFLICRRQASSGARRRHPRQRRCAGDRRR